MSNVRRRAILEAHAAALDAVDAERATRRALEAADGGTTTPVSVIAIGKAAVPMARGALDVLGDRVVGGVAVGTDPRDSIGPIEVLIGDHPYPGANSLAAGRAVAETARSAPGHVVFLVSGGGSSLVELPIEGVTVGDLAATSALLLEGGVDIHGLNIVRGSMSRLKRGGLRRLVTSPFATTLIVSDVIGDDSSTIASGPTVAPRPGGPTGRAVLLDAGVWDRLPEAVRRHLATTEATDAGWPYEDTIEVIATGRTAAEAAGRSLASSADVRLLERPIDGDATDAASAFTSHVDDGIVIGHGETTVTMEGAGVGGRNQHAALAVASRIAETGHVFAALSTDGIDGFSSAAGAIVDGGTLGRCLAAGVEPLAALERYDSGTALEASGDVVVTGPTGTNVGDLWIWWP